MTSNRVSLEDMRKMPIDGIVALPIDMLHALQNDLTDVDKQLKSDKALLHRAMDQRFKKAAADLRADAGKDTGAVKIDVADFIVLADLDKKVTWDKVVMADIWDRISENHEDPRTYFDKITLELTEGRFLNMIPPIQKQFTPARTVGTSSPKYTISEKKAK